MNQSVALDFGNVCVDVDYASCLRQLGISSIEQVPEELLMACHAFEIGALDEPQWIEKFRRTTGGKFSDRQLLDAYVAIVGDEIPGMDQFVNACVDKDLRVVGFSNTCPPHLDATLDKLSFAHLISGGVYSFEEGARKPEVEFYEIYEERHGRPALYLDDLPDNIDTAKRLGWNAVLFKNPRQALKLLREL